MPAWGAAISPSIKAIKEGIQHEKESDMRAALASFDQAVALDPANFRAYYFRGVLRSQQGDSAGALADLNRTLELKPDLPDAYRFRSSIEIGRGELAAGIADMQKANAMIAPQLDHLALSVQPDSRQATCKISDDSIDVGEIAVVTIRLVNCDGGITRYPVPDGLQMVDQYNFVSYSMKGGVAQTEVDFTFKLKAVRPGDYLIPAFTIPQKSGEVVVPAVRLTVSS